MGLLVGVQPPSPLRRDEPAGASVAPLYPGAVGCNPCCSSFSLGGLASLGLSPYSRFIEVPLGKHSFTYFL
jgi:hypothetical protein